MMLLNRPLTKQSMAGLTLVELLVSMFLGVLLSSAMVSTYLASKRSYFHDEQSARMQENGRFAMRLLTRELGMAGFYGGLLEPSQVPAGMGVADCSDTPWALSTAFPLDIADNQSVDAAVITQGGFNLTCLDASTIAARTDLLVIKRTASDASLQRGVIAENFTASTGQQWYLSMSNGEQPTWERWRPRDLAKLAGGSGASSYWEVVARIFFVRNYAISKGDGLPSLCMETLAGTTFTARCLVEGVENLQIEFGIDTDADGVPNRYESTPSPLGLASAVTARVHVLLRSPLPIAGHVNTQSYALGQTTVTAPGDAYLRRVFSSAVHLGNGIVPLG